MRLGFLSGLILGTINYNSVNLAKAHKLNAVTKLPHCQMSRRQHVESVKRKPEVKKRLTSSQRLHKKEHLG